MIAWLAALALPALAWLGGHVLAARRSAIPGPAACAALGSFALPGVVRWCGRSLLEQALAWLVAVVGCAGLVMAGDAQVFVAVGLLGAAWGFMLGLRTQRPPSPRPALALGDTSPTQQHNTSHEEAEEVAFRLELRCPSCGGTLLVPVYHGMARCEFCASQHLVVWHESPLVAVIPDSITSQEELHRAVVNHFRHRRYLELWDRDVRPLLASSGFAEGEPIADLPLEPAVHTNVLAEMADAKAVRAADAYAQTVRQELRIVSWRRLLSPYRHCFGTLFTTAFGRDAHGSKCFEFAVTTIEGSLPATEAPLPEMGKLSYLRALRALAGAVEAAVPALPVTRAAAEIEQRLAHLSQRRSDLSISPIGLHASFVPEVAALIYRPWHVAEVDLPGNRVRLLVDGGAGHVAGEMPEMPLPEDAVAVLPERPRSLAPSRCPDCGAELPFAPDAVAHLCRNCWRLLELHGSHLVAVPYRHEDHAPGMALAPFWGYALHVRGADGTVFTSFGQLAAAIAGTTVAAGAGVAQRLFVPAFQVRPGKGAERCYRMIWHAQAERAPELSSERLNAAAVPERVLAVTLGRAQARPLARSYLTLAFGEHELARATIATVRAALLDAEVEGEPELTYLALPDELVDAVAGAPGGMLPRAVTQLVGGADESAR
jgi:hypothetical protein